MFGLTYFHFRLLTDHPWGKDGGCGIPLSELVKMTPDQVYFLLSDRKLLESKALKTGSVVNPDQAVGFSDKDGLVRGKSKDGKLIRIPIYKDGKSKVQLIQEQIEREKREKNGS